MTTKDYIKELEKYLIDLETGTKDEIIQEIESYIKESDVDYDTLIERFGTPKELAISYLEDMPILDNKGKKVWSRAKKIGVNVTIFMTITFVIIASILYFMTREPFDYSLYTAKTIDEKIESPWIEIKDINNININQSSVVVYWSNESTIQISCKKNQNLVIENTLNIRQSECYLKVSKQKLNLKVTQSKIILIEPKNEIILDAEQSRIKIHENEGNYMYDFTGTQSDLNNFKSKKQGILIEGKFYQSKIDLYNY